MHRVLLIAVAVVASLESFSQRASHDSLKKFPVELETDFALSALPPHLRHDASVYLLDPRSGFYLAHQGSNGFICFVARNEWEWGRFSDDIAVPISFDSEGARTIFPVYQDVARMRASGKYTAQEIKDSVISRIHKAVYKAPARPGISYMLAPIMRTYAGSPGSNMIMTMSGPHYMFYAPYLTGTDIGSVPNTDWDGPILINQGGKFLGETKSPYGYMILPASEKEKSEIMIANQELLRRLANYKSYFKLDSGVMHH